jgi:hypothetical protein
MIKTKKYDFSFTASSLRLNEMLLVVRAYHDDIEVDYLPWGWGQPNNHSKQTCVAVRYT